MRRYVRLLSASDLVMLTEPSWHVRPRPLPLSGGRGGERGVDGG